MEEGRKEKKGRRLPRLFSLYLFREIRDTFHTNLFQHHNNYDFHTHTSNVLFLILFDLLFIPCKLSIHLTTVYK